MPQRGNRSRPDTDRLATVFGLVLAVAMISPVVAAIPSAHPDKLYLDKFNLNGGAGDDASNMDCKERQRSNPSPAATYTDVIARSTICITDRTPSGCEMMAAGGVFGGPYTYHEWRVALRFAGREVADERGAVFLYGQEGVADTRTVDYGESATVQASISAWVGTEDAKKYVTGTSVYHVRDCT